MNARKFLLAAAAVSLPLLLAACHDDDHGGVAGPLTLKQFAVDDVNTRTSDTTTPIEINDLAIDTSNEDPAAYDDLLSSI